MSEPYGKAEDRGINREAWAQAVVDSRIEADPHLEPFQRQLRHRIQLADRTERRLTGGKMDLVEFAAGHEHFGIHRRENGWVFREWAPNATAIYLKGPFSEWKAEDRFALSRRGPSGTWEIELPSDTLNHGDTYRLEMHWRDGVGERIPAWARRVVQDASTASFNAQIWQPDNPYRWQHAAPEPDGGPLLVYETHIGMATAEERTGTFDEFRRTGKKRGGGHRAVRRHFPSVLSPGGAGEPSDLGLQVFRLCKTGGLALSPFQLPLLDGRLPLRRFPLRRRPSMLYTHHGLGKAFTGYTDYFDASVDEDALAYLTLANRLIHSLNPRAVTVAEDVSGMPGLAVSDDQEGAGFDYRYAMGVPDYWIRLVEDPPDDFWPMGHLWHELTNRRHDEKTISYAESHDQAMVGDPTLIFRLLGGRIYGHMSVSTDDMVVSRGIALHKMIRLATLATAGHGYLNFMGNEFGHSEWIDFPREGNAWSHLYARRQGRLADDPGLRYAPLGAFDRDMIRMARAKAIPDGEAVCLLHADEEDKVLAFLRGALVFVFNFHPRRSWEHYRIPAAPGKYQVILDTDAGPYGGFNRRDASVAHETVTDRIHRHHLSLYLPSRTALVLEPRHSISNTDGPRP